LAPIVQLAVGPGEPDGPEEGHALAVDGGEEDAGRESGLARQFVPESPIDEVDLPLLFQLDDHGLKAVVLRRVDADEPRLVGLADRDRQQGLLHAEAGGEVLWQPQGCGVEWVRDGLNLRHLNTS
jgi:hypothetical protein